MIDFPSRHCHGLSLSEAQSVSESVAARSTAPGPHRPVTPGRVSAARAGEPGRLRLEAANGNIATTQPGSPPGPPGIR
jgi:hypothetical protein